MNLCDSFGVEELVTAPVSNAPLDHSHFHPTCKLRYIFRISAPPHFRLFEFFPQRDSFDHSPSRFLLLLLSHFGNEQRRIYWKFYCHRLEFYQSDSWQYSFASDAAFRDDGYRFTEFRVASINLKKKKKKRPSSNRGHRHRRRLRDPVHFFLFSLSSFSLKSARAREFSQSREVIFLKRNLRAREGTFAFTIYSLRNDIFFYAIAQFLEENF